jgi:hypothetical protein
MTATFCLDTATTNVYGRVMVETAHTESRNEISDTVPTEESNVPMHGQAVELSVYSPQPYELRQAVLHIRLKS